ncbi:MAG: ABC transporter permease subunit [Burkholderiales bacterium]|nr:ABC transporter permease subunit [Burkholderiales bacterium]
MQATAVIRANRQQDAGRSMDSPWRWLAWPALCLLLVAYVLPLGNLLLQSFVGTTGALEHYTRILSQSGYIWTIMRTIGLAAASTLLALVIGYPIAYVIATHRSARMRSFLVLCVAAPYLTSILIRTFAWQVLLGRVGLMNNALAGIGLPRLDLLFNSFAVIVGLTHFLLPLMILPLVSVMRRIDKFYLRAAANLGAGPARAFVRVFVPASLPGIEVGLVLCFVYGVGAFVTPALLGGNSGRMLGALIQTAIEQQADFGLAAAAAVILALTVGLIVLAFKLALSGDLGSLAAPGQAAAVMTVARRRGTVFDLVLRGIEQIAITVDRRGLSRSGRLVGAYAVVLGLLILLPQMVAIPISFSSTRTLIFPPPGWSTQWYEGFLEPGWFQPLLTSLQIGVAVTIAATVLGTAAAIGVMRGFSSRAASAAKLLLLLPLFFPTVVVGAAFFLALVPFRWTDMKWGIVVAHTTIALPFVFAIVSANLRTLDRRYEQAAAGLGAGLRAQMQRIVLPLLSGGILTSAFFAFLTSFDEAAIAIFLSGLRVKTLPRRMYEALAFESDPTVGVVAVLTMTAAALVLLGATLLRHRRGERHLRPITGVLDS